MTKSKKMQFSIREDELSPQKGLINEVEGNQHVIVKSGGQLSNLTTSSSTQEFETPDEKAKQEIESSERDSSYETTVKESILMISVENVEGYKSAENLDDGMNQRRLKNDDRDETTTGQKLCQASLETTGTKNNQKSVALKQHEITDELQNTKETHKLHEADDDIDQRRTKNGESEDTIAPREKLFQVSLETTDTKANQRSVAVKQKEIADGLQNNTEIDKIPVVIKTEHGEVRLIKVGKFHLISINGKKSKLPRSISQDTDLRLEKIGNDILLFTETICYRVRIEQDNIVLEDMSIKSLPLKPSSESHDTKENTANELKIDNENERDTKVGSIESEHKSNDVQHNINEQCIFEINQKDTSESRGETTQIESSSTQEQVEKTMKLQEDVKDITLIKVGKFWLISVNGRKSKLPKTINQDPTLKIEVDGVDLLLLSDSCCYKIRQNENKITLDEYNSYFQREPNDNISCCAKTRIITDQCGVHPDRYFDNYNQEHKCKESSDLELKEQTEVIRKGPYDIETEENASTNNAGASLPLDDRRHIGTNLETINGSLKNGENENQNEPCMTGVSEIARDARQDKYCPLLPDVESKETGSQDGMEDLIHQLESMNLKDKSGHTSPTVSATIEDQGSKEQIKFTDKGYKSTCTSLEAKGMQLQERSPPVVQIEGIEDENKLRLGKHVTKSIELPAHIPWSKLISKFNIASMIKESVDNVIVDMEMIGPFTSLKVVGLKKEIEAVEKYIKSEIIEKVCHEEIVISFKNMAVFKQPSFYDFLDKQLGGGTSLLLENNKLFAYSLNRDNLMKATRKVCTLVQETSVPLTGKWRSEDALKHLLGITVNNPCNVFTMVNSNKTCIIITGLKEHVERISEEIEELQKSGGIKKNYKLPEQVSSTKVNYEKKTYLQPSDVWQRLAHKFNIKATLESAVESVKVEFRKETTKMGHVCALVITGKKDDTELVSKHFEQHYKEKLFIKDLQLHVKRMDVFRKTDICDVLERKFADVIVLFQHDRLTVFSFDTIVGKRTADAVHKELKEERISVQGRFNKEDMAQLVDELKRNREGVYYIIDTVDSSLYVAGCKETVTKVINELSQKIKRDSASTIRAEIENMEAFEVLKLDENFLNDLKHRFGIEINIQNNQRCFEIKGEHTDVIFCEREIQQYCMDVISEQTEDLFEESDHVVSNAFQTRLDTVAEQNDVIIQRSLTNKSRHGPSFTDEMTDRKSFLFPNEHKLILPDQPEDDNCSDFIVHITEVSDNFGSTTRMVHHRKFVEMKVPYFKTDDAVIDITKNIIQPLLQEAERDNESVVEFKLPLMKTWSIDDMAYCWYSAIHEYFMNVDKNTNPKYVIICQPKEISYHYFVDCCKLQARKVTDAYGAVKHKRQPRFKITVESGKLNEIKADVLVNTVSANLDLKMGAVSSALLTTAGPLLQTEITKLYPHNLRPGDIAITGGYNLKCDKVFHGALNVYDEKNLLNITKQFRGFLKTCLFKASEYRATSIAFPAIGTGNLRYPVEFVVREMYDVVSEFEQKGYDTTLKDVLFVVFPGDFIAVDVFKKREAQENSILYTEREDGGSQHQQPKMCLKINVIGHKDKVRKARQTIDEMMLGKNKVIPVNLPTYADALKMPTVKTDLTSHLKPAMGIVETLSEPSDIRRAFRCCTVEGLTVRVYRRNILNLPVDCIVNAANKQLGHHSGIALAIANAAGNDFIRESKKIVQQYGELATGNATRTNPGQLSYKCVIHAVGPNWHDYSPYTAENVLKCQEDLKKAIISSLEIAEKFRMSTIAIPAVSSASFGVPKELCAMQYVKAVQTFSAQRPKHARSLAEVHFVDLDAEMIRLIKEAFSEMLINRQPCPWSWRIYVEKSTADAAKRHQAKLQNTDDHYQKRCPYYIDDGQILTCNYTPTRIVSVSKGDIFNLKDFDVIVCSEDESGSAAGGVAKLLLTKCGYQYEQEKKSLYKQKHPKTGEVHITHGGTSRYRFIMHAIMPHRLNCKSEGQWIKALEDMMNTIFYTAEKHRYKSMAMSLLGTGAGKSDPKRCAEILFDCFTLSCTRYKDSLFYLRVVNTDMGRNRIVTNVFKEHMTQPKY